MKLETSRQLDDQIPAQRSANYKIDPTAVVHITRILRNMYEDPVRAVVREYLANAIDAHKQAGQTKPIDLDAPTRMCPTFRCRDYGAGLSVEAVEHLLLGYGASGEEKRQSNEQIGGFGIGCKCAFAISDSFTYVSWHEGRKQTWLCQLDDHDMGEAKLVSHESSDEPSGLMIEIPVAKAQVSLFERHLNEVPMFCTVPLNISGTTVVPVEQLAVDIEGTLNGTFKSSKWFLYNNGAGTPSGMVDNDIVVVMGDLWYPVDTGYIEPNSASLQRVSNVLRPGGTSMYRSRRYKLAIRAPISTFSLAPTRESLQYDNATRTALKVALDEITDSMHVQAQKEVDKQEDIWTAAQKALKLQNDNLYKTGRSKNTAQPVFWWRGTEYAFDEALSIEAEDDNTGATITLVSRDLRRGLGDYAQRSGSNLRVFHVQLNQKHTGGLIVKDSKPKSTTLDVVTDLSKPLGAPSSRRSAISYAGRSSQPAAYPVFGMAENSNIRRFVLAQPIPVFTLDPKHSVEYYTRRYMVQNDYHIPQRDGFAIVVQGTREQCKAIFDKYPWLNKDVQPLPLLAAAKAPSDGVQSIRTGRSFASVENTFKYAYTPSADRRPSDAWRRLDKLPSGNPFYVNLSQFKPTESTPGDRTDESLATYGGASGCFEWLNRLIRLYALLKGKQPNDIVVYGFRRTKHKTEPPDCLHPFVDEVDAALAEWFDPGTLDNARIHGYHILTRFGPYGLFNTLRMSKPGLGQMYSGNRTSGNYLEANYRELLHSIRSEASEYLNCLGKTSCMRKFVELYMRMCGLDTTGVAEADLGTYVNALRLIVAIGVDRPRILCEMDKRVGPAYSKFVKPLRVQLDKLRDRYALLPDLHEIPVRRGPQLTRVLNYIAMVDRDKNRKGRKS